MAQTIQRLFIPIIFAALLTSATVTQHESKRARQPLCNRKFGQPNPAACGQALSLMSSDVNTLLTFGFEEGANDVKLPLSFSIQDCVIQVDSLSLHPQADREFNGSLKYEAIDIVTTCVQGQDRYGGESIAGRATNLAIYVFAHDSAFANEDAIAEAAIQQCFGGADSDASDSESVGSCADDGSLRRAGRKRTYCAAMHDCSEICHSSTGCACVPQKISQPGMLFGMKVAGLMEGIGSCVGSLVGKAGSVVTRGLDGDADARALEPRECLCNATERGEDCCLGARSEDTHL